MDLDLYWTAYLILAFGLLIYWIVFPVVRWCDRARGRRGKREGGR